MKRKLLIFTVTLILLLSMVAMPGLAATQSEIDQAIQDGLAWLATQQNATYGYFGSGYVLANTATAVLAFENEGHFPGGGNTYSTNVENGLDFIFTRAYKTNINTQTYGYTGRSDDPDSNGNGKGVFFSQYSYMYETGIVMQAIVASNTPDRVVSAGNCAGMTYRQVMEDLVDFCAWAQIDGGSGRGGWRYSYYNNGSGYGDNSVAQWPVLGLVAAEQWGINAPGWVKSELEYWVTYIQNPDGSSGYSTPGTYPNISKTGGLLVQFYYLGDEADSPRAVKALNYINSRWNATPNSWYGNKGHPYAMFSVFKGLELMGVATIPNALASPETPAGDWWGDYCEYLVNTQSHPATNQGYWSGYSTWGPYLATPWYIVILQASVFPVSVDIIVPGTACDETGYDISVVYNVQRFQANGTLTVYRDDVVYDTVTLTGFQGEGTANYNVAPETVGSHTWKAVLDVTGGGITTQAVDTATGEVYNTPQVSGIPDQYAPFENFDLDDYQTCSCTNVDWAALGVPLGWTVVIDTEHVVTVTAPEGATEPADITFQAIFHWPGIDCIDSDTATFSPNRPPVADAGRDYGIGEYYEVDECGMVQVDGSESFDPDGDEIVSYWWDMDEDGTFETEGMMPYYNAAGFDPQPGNRIRLYIFLKVEDEHGATGVDQARVQIYDQDPVIDSLEANPASVQCYKEPIEFTASGGDPGCDWVSIVWDFGDDSQESYDFESNQFESTVSHTYSDFGDYTVTLTVTDDDGASVSETIEVSVWDTTPPEITGQCVESVNPHGNIVPGKNRDKNSKEKPNQNPDGFYLLDFEITDNCDENPVLWVGTAENPYMFQIEPGMTVKFTESVDAEPEMKKIGSPDKGGATAVTWHIILPGDPVLTAIDASGNAVTCDTCLVPPPPM